MVGWCQCQPWGWWFDPAPLICLPLCSRSIVIKNIQSVSPTDDTALHIMCIFDRKGFNSKLSNPMTILTMILRAQQWRDGWRLKTHLVSPTKAQLLHNREVEQSGAGSRQTGVQSSRRVHLLKRQTQKKPLVEKPHLPVLPMWRQHGGTTASLS